MKKLLVLIGSIVTLTLASSCVYSEIDKNLTNAEKLRIGMTKAQAVAIMGEPREDQIFADENNYYYVNSVRSVDGLVTRDECMVLTFENDKLVGFGKKYNSTISNVK